MTLKTLVRAFYMKVLGICFLGAFVFYVFCLNYLESGEAGLTWNPLSGEISAQTTPGWQLSSPLVFVSRVDLRPQRLCMTSAAHAAVNCKLVEFDMEHRKEFIATEGWGWYWWANRVSFNFGHAETYRGFRDILRGYAFSSTPYPFIKTTLEE